MVLILMILKKIINPLLIIVF